MPLSLADWQGFYVVTGSAGAGLTGLMFVVVALAADRMQTRGAGEARSIYSSPTVTHFSIVLLIASIMTMPLHRTLSAAICIGATAAIGLTLSGLTGLRMSRLEAYSAVAEDWLGHVVLPLVAYALLLAGACLLSVIQPWALVFVAVAVLALLFTGIHNAWDVALYVVNMQAPQPPQDSLTSPSSVDSGGPRGSGRQM